MSNLSSYEQSLVNRHHEQKEIISSIHKWPLFWVIVEVGAWTPIAQNLYEFNWASKTIFNTHSPYHPEYQNHILPEYFLWDKKRSVSWTFTQDLSKRFIEDLKDYKNQSNFIITTSFQTWDDEWNNNKRQKLQAITLTHGYITVALFNQLLSEHNFLKTYHLSIREDLPRSVLISRIGEIGTNILYDMNQLITWWEKLNKISQNGYIDSIETIFTDPSSNQNNDNNDMTEVLSTIWANSMIFINEDGKLQRPEDRLRDKNIVVIKWSFNPIHKTHKKLYDTMRELYPDHEVVLAISVTNYFNKPSDPKSIAQRIKDINRYDIPVVVFGQWLFKENVDLLRYNNPSKEIIFTAWSEVIDKIDFEHDAFDSKIKFIELSRNGMSTENKQRPWLVSKLDDWNPDDISSTMVRAAVMSWDIKTVCRLIGDPTIAKNVMMHKNRYTEEQK